MAHAYYDQVMTLGKAKQMLSQLGATQDKARSTTDKYVYKIRGGGEAMVESEGGSNMRVRMYKGKCPC